jgi:protease-4
MRDFLKYTLASFTGAVFFFIVLMAFITVGAIGLIGALIAGLGSRDRAIPVDQDSVLVYDLSTPITDTEEVLSPTDALFGLQAGGINQLTLREAVHAIEHAATDDRIVALYLAGSDASVATGGAILSELRRALDKFRESGKPIYAYDTSWDEREYYLASVADTIFMNPFGEIEMNGLFVEVMYQAEAFQKLGIGVQVTRVGQYKSAVEPLVRNEMSPEEREQLQAILDDLWSNVIQTSAEYRSINPQQIQAIANGPGLLFGDDAETSGFVDEMAYLDEVVVQLRELTGESPDETDDSSFRQIDLSTYAAASQPSSAEVSDSNQQIAVLYAEGPIVTGTGEGLGQVIAGDRLAKELRQLRQDEAVKAIVLRVNSPGGSVTASEVILREIQLARDAKPVIVSMGNVAASGGYWISTFADQIYAEPTTITGSIGVFGAYINLEELGDNIGINWDVVKTGDTADIFTVTRPKTEKELSVLQQAVDRIYDEFLERVSNGRDLPPERVAELAQGRVWSGVTAQEIGLVDELGGLEEAIQAAAEMAELSPNWQVKEYPEGDGLQQFLERLGSPRKIASQDVLTAQLNRFKEEIQLLRTMNDPRHIYFRMPYTIEIK